MNRRNLLKSLATLALSLSHYAQAQEPRRPVQKEQEYEIAITRKRKKYYITKKHEILDESKSRVTDQNILRDIIQTYLISQELPNYKKTAEEYHKKYQRAKTRTQLEYIITSGLKIIREPIEIILQTLKNPEEGFLTKLKLAKAPLDATIKEFCNLYLDPKMYLYTDITLDLQAAEKHHKKFIDLIDRADLTDYEEAQNTFNLLLRSEPIIIAAAHSFREIRNSENEDLQIKDKEKQQFVYLLKQKAKDERETRIIQRRRQAVCNKIRERAQGTDEKDNYESKKEEETQRIKDLIFKNMTARFNL